MGKKIEEMAPLHELTKLLEVRTNNLLNLIKSKEHALKSAPSGSVRIVERRNKVLQFYRKEEDGDYQGKYMPREEDALARRLVQKDYDECALEKARRELRLIQSFQTSLQKNSVDTVYQTLDENRKSLVTPATLTDAQYVEFWQNVSYRKKKIDEAAQKLTTEKGEIVRSKSEVIIANTLKSHNVPYRYEYPLVLEVVDEDHREFHPDFLCLNLRTRQEFVWEHFGMMDDAEYAERAVQKLSLYSANGYFPGKNLIITMESQSMPLSSQEINRIINEYLK